MLAPLVILAILSVFGGWIGIPESMGGSGKITHYLAPAVSSITEAAGPASAEVAEHSKELIFAGLSVAVAALGFFVALWLYYIRPELPNRITQRIHGLYSLVYHKYYVDEGYGMLLVKPLLAISTHVLWRGVDQTIIDGAVNGAGSASKGIGSELRRMQSGNIRSYAAWVAIGGAAVIAYMIWRGVGK
jgi:NADH-quinone oxidoreductase subunit L